jgi:hypothetical protein
MTLLATPWLAWPPALRRRTALTRHVLILAGMILAVAFVRHQLGDSRLAVGYGLDGLIERILVGGVWGPIIGGLQYVRAPLVALLSLNKAVSLAAFAGLVAILALLWLIPARPFPPNVFQSRYWLNLTWPDGSRTSLNAQVAPPLLLLGGGALMWGLGYVLSFTHFPPTAIAGRQTSVHFAGALGAALTMTGLMGWLQSRLPQRPALVRLTLAVYLATLVGFGYRIQQDYVTSWRLQRDFWQQVTRLVPDLDDGTFVLVEEQDLPQTYYIMANSWGDNLILDELYQFPSAWRQPPRLFHTPPDWTETVVAQDGRRLWIPPGGLYSSPLTLPNGNLILLGMESGRLVRRSQAPIIAGEPLRLKPATAGSAPWPTKTLYHWLITAPP